MKKALCMILTVILLLGTVGFSAGAADETIRLNSVRAFNGNSYILNRTDYRSAGSDGIVSSPEARLKAAALPESYDARNAGVIPPVRNQGYTGCCWAFASISALESDCISRGLTTLDETDFSEAHLGWFGVNCMPASPDHNAGEGLMTDDPLGYGGHWLFAAQAFSGGKGPALEEDYPFPLTENYSEMTISESERYNNGAGITLDSVEALRTEDEIKQGIMEHGSLMTSIFYDFGYEIYSGLTSVYYCPEEYPINHAVAIIGWDDNFTKGHFRSSMMPEGDGAWLCRDSWGDQYHDGGYFWLSYYDANFTEAYSFSARPSGNVRHNYCYNAAAWENVITHQGTASLANIFTTSEYERLTAVSTYNVLPNTRFKVSIYTGLSRTATNPKSGTLVSTFTKTIARDGFYMLDLPQPVSIEPNTRFAVVMEITGPAGVAYFPIEVDNEEMGMFTYTYSSKETFLNLPEYASGWREASAFGVKNAYIQAFTECDHREIVSEIPATCTGCGHYSCICTQCGQTIEDYEIPASGHTFVEERTERGGRVTVSTQCETCGEKHEISYSEGRTLTLDSLLEILFSRWVNILRTLTDRLREAL